MGVEEGLLGKRKGISRSGHRRMMGRRIPSTYIIRKYENVRKPLVCIINIC